MSYVTKKEAEQFRELGYFGVTPPAFDRAILADMVKAARPFARGEHPQGR